MKPILKPGWSKIDITPASPVPLAGFAHRKGCFEGISRALHLRVLFLLQRDADRMDNRSIIVSADLIWWDTRRAKRLRKIIAERWGLPESAVILHATHSHSGPQTSDRFAPTLGEPDPEYIRYVEDRLLIAVERAYSNLEPVTIERGIGHCGIGIHRRKSIDGKMVMAPNPEGAVDHEMNVICFRTRGGQRIKAILVHYTCHPTTTGDNYVSSEYPGVAMDVIEEKYGGDLAAVFLQGCCGDVRPALIKDETFFRGSDHEVCELGRTLAGEVWSVLESKMQVLEPSIKSKAMEVLLSLNTLPSHSELLENTGSSGIMGEWSTLLLHQPERL
jgi:hypothetical protein